MNITDLAIEDPRRYGQYRNPYVLLKVNEDVQEIGAPITPSTLGGVGNYRLVPCGPFFASEYEPEWGEWYDGVECVEQGYDIGILNKLGLVKDQLAAVKVCSPTETLDLVMPVPRLRRLVRKFIPSGQWLVVVDEQAALEGLLKWRLELSRPTCYGGASPNQANCHQPPIQTIVVKNTHLPVCPLHLERLQSDMRKARTTPRGR